MSDAPDDKPRELLQMENRRLRTRVQELERKMRESNPKTKSGSIKLSPQESRIFELVKQKDRALDEYAARMEQKARELEALVQELNRRNEELSNGMAVLRLYQMMFENEPAGIVGVDKEGRVIQFNSSALRYFGLQLHSMRLQHVSGLTLDEQHGESPDLGALFERAMGDGDGRVETSAGDISIRCYRLEDVTGLRGVVFRASGLPETDGES